jgi:hypothetical protein
VVITPVVVHAKATNELKPIPGQSAAFSAGYSQGYLGVPLKGYHPEQFLLGYINGTKVLQESKAEVAGYMGMKWFVNNDTMTYYKQGAGIRSDVECGDQEPIGTLPTHPDDNYKLFYEGYHDGSLLRDSSDPGEDPNNNPNCPLGHSTEYCAGFKFGWNNDEALINPPDDYDCPGANK